MAIAATRVTVATTATKLNGTDNATRFSERLGFASSILVKVPTGGQDVVIGAAGVTFANGYTLSAGESLGIDLREGDDLYGIVTATTQVVHVIQTDI